MTTEHQDDQRRSGGFREAVNELFGRNEHDSRDSRDTSQLDALDRDEARRHGDPDPTADRHAYGDQAAVAQPGEARLDDSAGQTTPGARYDAGADSRVDDTATAGHGDPLADNAAARENIRFDDGVVDDRPGSDPRGQETAAHGQPLGQEQHLGETQTPHGGEVRGDTVAPEHVRQGGDPTAQGQVQHGGELRGDAVGTRSDAERDAGTSVRDTGAASDADLGAGAPARDAGSASTAGVGAGAAHHDVGTGGAHHDSSADGDEERAALVTRDRAESYSARWDSVKGEFVDEPRRAVADADALVGELLDELQELFKQQRTQIEQGLDADETSTEDLRVALRRYRSFFDRLLSI
ncbi:MAG TPA: hypothetical protein VJT79_00045 [Pseudonocardia sp.]|nr:hypothetical protein [Pseudonocardia sp.]